jgi:hypothetical protein
MCSDLAPFLVVYLSHIEKLSETKPPHKRFVDESRHRSGYHTSDNHSFDDDIVDHTTSGNGNDPDYSVPFGIQDDDQPIFVVEQVPVEDLSSWESSQDEDLNHLISNPNQPLKHSPGMIKEIHRSGNV